MAAKELLRPEKLLVPATPPIGQRSGAYASVLCLRTDWQMLRHMPTNLPAANVTERRASLFRNGRNQAVRIPREFEMEGTEVLMRKEGDRLIDEYGAFSRSF